MSDDKPDEEEPENDESDDSKSNGATDNTPPVKGRTTQIEAGVLFNIDRTVVGKIWSGIAWGHIS